MSPEKIIEYVQQRLAHWADWFSRGNLYGLGYPPCSIEYRLMTEGIVRTQHHGSPPIATNKAAEEMEVLVKEMSLQNNKMALVLRCYYFYSGSLRRQAKQVGMSYTSFKAYVDMGHQWLAGRLSAKLKIGILA